MREGSLYRTKTPERTSGRGGVHVPETDKLLQAPEVWESLTWGDEDETSGCDLRGLES